MFSLLLSGTASGANDTLQLTFTYTVTEGTCSVSVPPTVSFGDVSQDADFTNLVGKSWSFTGIRILPVTLGSCSGSGSTSGPTPAIILSGVTPSTTGSANKKAFLIMPAKGVTGLGMVIAKPTTTLTSGKTSNLVTLVAGNIYIDTGTAAGAPQLNTTINLPVALACGDSTDCKAADLKVGTDSMVLTFSFGYH